MSDSKKQYTIKIAYTVDGDNANVDTESNFNGDASDAVIVLSRAYLAVNLLIQSEAVQQKIISSALKAANMLKENPNAFVE